MSANRRRRRSGEPRELNFDNPRFPPERPNDDEYRIAAGEARWAFRDDLETIREAGRYKISEADVRLINRYYFGESSPAERQALWERAKTDDRLRHALKEMAPEDQTVDVGGIMVPNRELQSWGILGPEDEFSDDYNDDDGRSHRSRVTPAA